ncbi:DUF1330 domain-containing protein [Aquisalimonas asiatica]|uniref:Uncharacterized conserved protein, DUF1330 family n=1 Tax=Aquisalimonas asiatica TaxID=406100 RepID=A0A1H8SVA1_9GAMM|nr:DUF1330 domain-containing protein [Aquisalimonas asiatica]SEO82602.1 Uncharacterized conserved protein, DUF1330 family [Aquisalimonas asiatica]
MTAYWLALVDVDDEAAYKEYAQRAPAAIEAYGGRVLARGGRRVGLEGAEPPGRVVIIEFDSVEQAEACFNSPEYQAARALRSDAADARFMIVEGLQ